MHNIKDLLDILKSQEKLYSEMLSILTQETESVSTWDSEKTLELAKKKDTLTYKERILDEAFTNCLKKVQKEIGRSDLKVDEIAASFAGEYSEEMTDVRARLIRLVNDVQIKNNSLKILYKTNISLIEGVFGRFGLAGKNTYGINGYNTGKTSTICQTG
jgi:hypothetical protein